MVRGTWLLCFGLCCACRGGQGQASQGRPWERREAAPSPALLGHEHYARLQDHLGTVRALSREYWHLLACKVWQEGCEGEEEEAAAAAAEDAKEQDGGGRQVILEPQGWSLLIMSEIVSSWYCSFGKCCATGDCRVANNITGLELDLRSRLHGQHLAKGVVLKAIQGFLETSQPEKALALSFHGWSGTGKNFVARIIAEHLYRDGLKSDCVKVFISLFHFPHSKYVDIYKTTLGDFDIHAKAPWILMVAMVTMTLTIVPVQLAKQISETVQLCEQSLFIFDEAEKLHAGLLDALKPYVDHYDSIDTVDYRRSIFLFLSNTGGNFINEVALDFWRAGRSREEITMEYLEQHLRTELLEATVEGYARNHLLEDNLIDFLVPFLPLEYRHVKLCARDAFLARGLPFTEEALDEVARMMVFVPKEEKLFSAQGCKSVSQRINYFLP